MKSFSLCWGSRERTCKVVEAAVFVFGRAAGWGCLIGVCPTTAEGQEILHD